MSIARPIDMETIENALTTWVVDSTDLVIAWKNQSVSMPPYPYGILHISNPPKAVSDSWDVSREYDATRPLEKELRFDSGVPCQFTAEFQTFVLRPDSRNPSYDAMQYVLRAVAALQNLEMSAPLVESGIAMARVMQPQNISNVVADAHVSRALVEVVFNATMSTVWYTGFIGHVNMTSTVTNVEEIITVTV